MATPESPSLDDLAGQHRGHDTIRQALSRLIDATTHELDLWMPTMESRIFNSTEIVDALAHFAARHARNRARILIEKPAHVRGENPRLMEVCRRFSDFIQIRCAAEEHRGHSEGYLIADKVNMVMMPDVTRAEIAVKLDARTDAAQILHRFQPAWDHGEPAKGIYTLGL